MPVNSNDMHKIGDAMKNPYLKENRLADVLALIQILAMYEYAHRSDDGIRNSSKAEPVSANGWHEIAKEHPEFFRYVENKDHSISLIARHAQKDTNYPPLSTELTTKLMETAIKIHDSQLTASRWWIFWMPVLGAFLGALLAKFIKL